MSKKTGDTVLSYLKRRDPQLHRAIVDLCAEKHCSIKKGKDGITFLYPTDEAYRNEIIDAAGAGDLAEEKAVQIIQSLSLPFDLQDYSQFVSMRDDLPNELKQKLPITNADAHCVHLSNGAKIIHTRDFVHGLKEHVYDLVGRISLEGERTGGRYQSARSSSATGGCHYATSPTTMFYHDVQERTTALASGATKNPLVERVISYMSWSEKNDPSAYFADGGEFECVTGIPDVDYFALLRLCYSAKFVNQNISKWITETYGVYVSNKGANVYDDYLTLYQRQAAAYWAQRGGPDAEKKAHQAKIAEREDTLKDISRPKLRASVKAHYGGNYNKLWADDIRMAGCHLFMDSYDGGRQTPGSFRDFVFTMKNLYAPTGKEGDTLVLASMQTKERDVCLHISTLIKFARSNASYWIPISVEMADSPEFGDKSYNVVVDGAVQDEVFNWFGVVLDTTRKLSAQPSMSLSAYTKMAALAV